MFKFLIIYCFINCLLFGDTNQFEQSDSVTEEDESSSEHSHAETESPAEECPPSMNSYSPDEIKELIDYIYVNEGFDKDVQYNYVSQTRQLANEISMPVTAITSWIQREPGSFRGVLVYLNKIRKNIEPKVNIIDGIVRQYPQLKLDLQQKLNSTQKYLSIVESIDRICELHNCSRHPHPIAKRNANPEKYCNSFGSLIEEIREKLHVAVNNLNKDVNETLNHKREDYFLRIGVIREGLNQAVLKYFGGTMYNILKLQNDYITFISALKFNEIKVNSQYIGETLLELNTKLIILGRVIQEYRHYCIHCNERDELLIMDTRRADPDKNSNITLVDALIASKFVEISMEVTREINKGLLYLDTKIRALENIDNYMNSLEPVKNELARLTQQERNVLKELQRKAPSNAVMMFVSLLKDAKQTLKQIEDVLKRISP